MKYCPLATQEYWDEKWQKNVIGQAECKESCAWYANLHSQCVMISICEEMIKVGEAI